MRRTSRTARAQPTLRSSSSHAACKGVLSNASATGALPASAAQPAALLHLSMWAINLRPFCMLCAAYPNRNHVVQAACHEHSRCHRFGADMPWPAVEKPQPGTCALCGGPCVAELQLMPGLLAAIGDGLAWLAERDIADTRGSMSPPAASIEHWTWLTLAVFTCKTSCSGSDSWTIAEGQIVMCQEQ